MNIMKKYILLFVLFAAVAMPSGAQMNELKSHPEAYQISQKDIDRAQALINAPLTESVVVPNPNPDAQWFPDASLGLFMHWGIHSVVGAQPSWDMITNFIYGGRVAPPDKYYALANRFKPVGYDPYKYLKAAHDAGFTYAVLTSRHHDGYALWPSEYGIGTKQYMQGRDLLREYIDACRKSGLKVGIYYSPRDWHYPGFMDPKEFDSKTSHDLPAITDSVANYNNYVKFMAYVMKQVEELLTNYGKIDILWFDGMNFKGVRDMQTEKIYAWIRTLQPGIVVNDRWSNEVNPDNPGGSGFRFGDFTTPFECMLPTHRPSLWWEHCDCWTFGGHHGWGYNTEGTFRPVSWLLEHLVASRQMGGNFLPNVGPDPNGNMHPNFYTEIDTLAEWMKYGKESVIGAGPSPGIERSNVMITTRGANIWYLHVLPAFNQQVSVFTEKEPLSLTLLRTGEAVAYDYNNGYLTFKLNKEQRTTTDDVVKIAFPETNMAARAGWRAEPDISVNTHEFAVQYAKNKTLWDKVFNFMATHDITKMENGKYDIDGQHCWATISRYLPKQPSELKAENHHKYVDLQFVADGNEMMGLAGPKAKVIQPYVEKNDIMFYDTSDMTYYPAVPNRYFLFFPGDKHQPSVAYGTQKESTKIVFKIEYQP